MPASEAARNDLYNGLSELLGPQRAETLMAYLPFYDPNEVARRLDVDRIETRLDRIESRFDRFEDEIKTLLAGIDARFEKFDARFDTMNARIDRLFLSYIGGLFVVLAAMVGLAII